MFSCLNEMSYEEFIETIEVLEDANECKIPFIPEPEMVRAVLGYTETNNGIALTYSVGKILEILMERDKMTETDAMGHYSYNIERGARYSNYNVLFVY